MATIKSYTDLEQSRKLAKILPLESADMFYNKEPEDESYPKDIVDTKYPIVLREGHIRFLEEYGIPCWSLAALLSIIPEVSLNVFKDGKWNAMVQYSGKIIYEDKDNPVDACYEMIIRLNKLNLL